MLCLLDFIEQKYIMSDSSEQEDLSRFREAVDTSFDNIVLESKGKEHQQDNKCKLPSERYLNIASHYNDVKVPETLQNQIGDKISKIISKSIEFVDMELRKPKKQKIKGGVKLFRNSVDYLKSEEVADNFTKTHNENSKRLYKGKRKIENDILDEHEKAEAVAVTGDYVLSKEDTKYWKSRRKEKLFKYKSNGKSKVLLAVE